MFDAVTARPAICLNMIVRSEAHFVHEVRDAVAPYISSRLIVDTGSNDGTQDLIRNAIPRLGIPSELYERPWRNFGHNRTDALTRPRATATTSGSWTPTTRCIRGSARPAHPRERGCQLPLGIPCRGG